MEPAEMASRSECVSAAGAAHLRTSRRGRPTADRAAAIENIILAASLKLFLDCGYEAATMEGIAERARVSKGTLYARYPGKEPLFRAVLKDRVDRWSALNGAWDDRLPAELGPRLQAHARTLQRMFEWPEFIQINRLIRTASDAFPDVAAYWHEIASRKFIRFLAEDMKTARGDMGDEIGGAEPDWDFLANLFLHSYAGWHNTESIARKIGEAEAAAFADQVIQSILAIIASAGSGHIIGGKQP
jgi:AcrR family transcriptional regulator